MYITNDCGVVTNPDIIWKYVPKNYLAWCYWELKVGKCNNGFWDYGYTVAGGGSPVSFGCFKSKDEAIEKGVEYINTLFKNGFKGEGMYKEIYFCEAQNNFAIFKGTQTNILSAENLKGTQLAILF